MELHDQVAVSGNRLPQELLTLAGRLRRSGMATPIGFLLAAHRPLRGVAGLCEDAVAPLFRSFLGAYGEPIRALIRNDEQFDYFVALLLGEETWEE